MFNTLNGTKKKNIPVLKKTNIFNFFFVKYNEPRKALWGNVIGNKQDFFTLVLHICHQREHKS